MRLLPARINYCLSAFLYMGLFWCRQQQEHRPWRCGGQGALLWDLPYWHPPGQEPPRRFQVPHGPWVSTGTSIAFLPFSSDFSALLGDRERSTKKTELQVFYSNLHEVFWKVDMKGQIATDMFSQFDEKLLVYNQTNLDVFNPARINKLSNWKWQYLCHFRTGVRFTWGSGTCHHHSLLSRELLSTPPLHYLKHRINTAFISRFLTHEKPYHSYPFHDT